MLLQAERQCCMSRAVVYYSSSLSCCCVDPENSSGGVPSSSLSLALHCRRGFRIYRHIPTVAKRDPEMDVHIDVTRSVSEVSQSSENANQARTPPPGRGREEFLSRRGSPYLRFWQLPDHNHEDLQASGWLQPRDPRVLLRRGQCFFGDQRG